MKEKTLQLDAKKTKLGVHLADRARPKSPFSPEKTLKKVELKKLAFEIPERKFFKLL